MNINDLKAKAYDTLVQIEILQNSLKQINIAIAEEIQKEQKEKNKTNQTS
jgi:hypothetical protein